MSFHETQLILHASAVVLRLRRSTLSCAHFENVQYRFLRIDTRGDATWLIGGLCYHHGPVAMWSQHRLKSELAQASCVFHIISAAIIRKIPRMTYNLYKSPSVCASVLNYCSLEVISFSLIIITRLSHCTDNNCNTTVAYFYNHTLLSPAA